MLCHKCKREVASIRANTWGKVGEPVEACDACVTPGPEPAPAPARAPERAVDRLRHLLNWLADQVDDRIDPGSRGDLP
jgi:hypothetical protein